MRRLAIAGMLLLISVVIIMPVMAQDEWECDFDFTLAQYSFVTVGGVWESGTEFNHSDQGSFRQIAINFDLPATTLTEASMTFDYTEGTFTPESPALAIWNGLTILQSALPSEVSDGPQTYTWSGSVSVSNPIQLQIVSSFDSIGPISYSGAATLESAHLEGTGTSPCATYTRPVAAEQLDLLTENLTTFDLENPTDNAVFAFSFTPGASVFSAAAGTITEMRLLNPDTDCDENFNRPAIVFAGPCSLTMPDSSTAYIAGGQDTAGSNVYLVRLLAEGVEFTYFVEAADYYLSEGQQVEAGCTLGRTFAVETGNPPESLSEPGLSIVVARIGGTIVPLINSLAIEPEGENACNLDPDNANCMGDVQLNDPSQWESSSGVMFNDPGFTILGGFDAHIRTSMNLDPAQMPELIVRLRATGGGDGNVELTLGQTTEGFSITEGSFQTITIEATEHEADGDFYTVRIKNDGTSNLDIQSVCVRFTEDGEGNHDVRDRDLLGEFVVLLLRKCGRNRAQAEHGKSEKTANHGEKNTQVGRSRPSGGRSARTSDER